MTRCKAQHMRIGAHATQHDGVGAGLDDGRQRRVEGDLRIAGRVEQEIGILGDRIAGRPGDTHRPEPRQDQRQDQHGALVLAHHGDVQLVPAAPLGQEVPRPDAYLGKALEDASGAGKLLERQPVRGDRLEPGRARHDLHGERAGALPLRRRGCLDVDAMNRHFEHDVLNELGRIHSGPPMAAGPLCNTEVFSTGKMPPINLSHSSPRRERRHLGVKAAAGPATGRPCRRVRHAGGGPPPRHLPICAPAARPRRRGSGTARSCSETPWR